MIFFFFEVHLKTSMPLSNFFLFKSSFILRLFFLYKFVSIKYKTTIKIEMIDVEIGKSEGISLWQP